jgi:hypothetical protein
MAIGDLVGTLSGPGTAGETYTLTSNPGNLFAISGSNLIEAANVAAGQYPITIQAVGSGLNITQSFLLNFSGYVPNTWVPGMRPFLPTAPVNTPLAADSILVPALWPPVNNQNYYAVVKFPIDLPGPNAPIVTMTTATTGWGTAAGTVVNVPMTSGFSNNGDIDKEAFSVIGNTVWSWLYLVRQTDTTAILGQYANCDVLLSDGLGHFNSIPPYFLKGAGTVAAGSSDLLGALVKEEFTAGEINHWISFSGGFIVNQGSPNDYFGPWAINGDGHVYNGLIMEGMLMAIPKTTTMPSGLSTYGQKIFRAMQNYGAFCNDTSGSTDFYMAQTYNAADPNTTWTAPDANALVADSHILFPLLQKVGPVLDGLTFVIGAYSTFSPQAQSSLYAGQAMHITRDSDSTGTDIPFGAAPQYLLNTSAITSFCLGTVGRVSTYYEQLGHPNFTSAGSSAPIIYQSGSLKNINGKPALSFDGSTNYLVETGSSGANTQGPTMYFNWVGQLTDLAANYCLVGPDTAGGLELRVDQTTGFVRLLKNGSTTIGVTSVAMPTGVPINVESYYNFDGSWSIWVNATNVASGTGTLVAVNNANIQIGAGPGGTELFKGLVGQCLVCSSWAGGGGGAPQTAPQFAIQQYLKSYWGSFGAVTLLQDGFVDTNGTNLASHTMTLGSGWTNQVGTHQIQSNSAQPNALVSNVAIVTTPGYANGTYSCTLTPFWDGGINQFEPGLVFRYTNSTNFLLLQAEVTNAKFNLYTCIAGVFTVIATLPAAIVSGTAYAISLTLSGSNISFTVNGANLTTATNSFNSTATLVGFRSGAINSPATKCSYNTLKFTT